MAATKSQRKQQQRKINRSAAAEGGRVRQQQQQQQQQQQKEAGFDPNAVPRGAAPARPRRAEFPWFLLSGRDVAEVRDLPRGIFDGTKKKKMLEEPPAGGQVSEPKKKFFHVSGLRGQGSPEMFVKQMPRGRSSSGQMGEYGSVPDWQGGQNLNEAFALLELQKEGLAGVLQARAVFKDADYLYVFMEYCAAGDLYSIADARETSGNENALRLWAIQLLLVVQELHDSGWVHGDLCLENLVVTGEGSNVLRAIDFAQSFKVHAPGEPHNEVLVPRSKEWRTGRVKLWPPEMLNPPTGEKSSAKKRDMYMGVGCVLFMLAVSSYPFSEEEVLQPKRPRHEDPETGACWDSISRLWHWWPSASPPPSPELQRFLGRLMAPDPNKRLSATEALAHPWIVRPVA